MQKVKITKISKRDGEGEKGRWVKYGIQTDVHGDKWLGCFENKYNQKKLEALTEGASVDIIVKQNGDFLNFSFPSQIDYLEQRVAILEKRVGVSAEDSVGEPEVVAETDVPF